MPLTLKVPATAPFAAGGIPPTLLLFVLFPVLFAFPVTALKFTGGTTSGRVAPNPACGVDEVLVIILQRVPFYMMFSGLIRFR